MVINMLLNSNRELEGKNAIVTGASRGIGRAIAVALAKEGAFVVVNYNGSQEKAEETLALIREAGSDGILMRCNVADDEECKKMTEQALSACGHIDILVNNAGITKDNLLMRMTEEEFDSVIDTNLKGSFHTIRHLSRAFLKQRSGRIINLSSVSGRMGNAGQANYSASKAGVIGLTKSVARELAVRGITCNAVAPGFIETEMTAVLPEKAKETLLSQIPMQRAGKAEEIADVVVFLASERASYITGQVIGVDGGMY